MCIKIIWRKSGDIYILLENNKLQIIIDNYSHPFVENNTIKIIKIIGN